MAPTGVAGVRPIPVILLAQASMARVVETLAPEDRRKLRLEWLERGGRDEPGGCLQLHTVSGRGDGPPEKQPQCQKLKASPIIAALSDYTALAMISGCTQ